jgi:hypothetical protein
MITREQYVSIVEKNERRKAIKGRTTPGPWYVRMLDDERAMNLVAVSVRPDTGKQERWPDFDAAEIVAVTLAQSPRYADTLDQRWDENAEFIAFTRGDDPEGDIDTLLAEIERLRAGAAC